MTATVGGRVLRYCLYGPTDGFPVIAHNGTPSTRLRRPDQIEAMRRGRVRVLMPDRPGYGGSTRRPGRSVADVAEDVRALADAEGWDRFAVFGGSGGGPHALACAALLPERVIRCAVLSGPKPSQPRRPGTPERSKRPEISDILRAPDERALRLDLERISRDIMTRIAAGGPEMSGVQPDSPARDNPEAMERLRATFVDSFDGWVDDKLAFARPWGFALSEISVPVALWYGTHDQNIPADHAQWLLANIPGAQGHQYDGGHVPGPDTFGEIYDWLRGGPEARAGG